MQKFRSTRASEEKMASARKVIAPGGLPVPLLRYRGGEERIGANVFTSFVFRSRRARELCSLAAGDSGPPGRSAMQSGPIAGYGSAAGFCSAASPCTAGD